MFFSKEVEQYAIPFMGSDPSVVKRTQRFLHEEEQQSPVRLYQHTTLLPPAVDQLETGL